MKPAPGSVVQIFFGIHSLHTQNLLCVYMPSLLASVASCKALEQGTFWGLHCLCSILGMICWLDMPGIRTLRQKKSYYAVLETGLKKLSLQGLWPSPLWATSFPLCHLILCSLLQLSGFASC